MIKIVKDFSNYNPCVQLTAKKCVEITLEQRFVDPKHRACYSIRVKNLFFESIDSLNFTIDEVDQDGNIVNSTQIRKRKMYIKKNKHWVLFGEYIKVSNDTNELRITVTKILFESVGYFRGGIGDIEEPLFELKPGETYIHPKRTTYPTALTVAMAIIVILGALIMLYEYLDIFVR